MWIPTKGALARPTGNQYLPVRKFVSSGANFRVPSLLAENPQIFRDRLTHSCVSRAGLAGGPAIAPAGRSTSLKHNLYNIELI
jgi:hypothetical protein